MGKKETEKEEAKVRLARLLEEGTPREKALFICKEWEEPRTFEMYGRKPTITEEERQRLINSLWGSRERAEFNKWMNYYDLYTDLIQLTGLGAAEYEKAALNLIGYLRIWDGYGWEAEIINSAYQFAKEKGAKTAANFAKHASAMNKDRKYGELKQRADGTFYMDITRLYEDYIKPAQENTIATYSAFKGFIEVLEKFAYKTKSKDFLPEQLAWKIHNAKQDYKAFNLSPRYSCKELRKRKEKGEQVTEEDEKRAVFPEYKRLQVNPAITAHFKALLKEKQRK